MRPPPRDWKPVWSSGSCTSRLSLKKSMHMKCHKSADGAWLGGAMVQLHERSVRTIAMSAILLGIGSFTARGVDSTDARTDGEMVMLIQRRIAAPGGHDQVVSEVFKATRKEVAFVTQHLWNVGEPDGPSIPEHFDVGMGSRENTRRAQRINWQFIRPALGAARRASLCVVHSQPGFIAQKWPQN